GTSKTSSKVKASRISISHLIGIGSFGGFLSHGFHQKKRLDRAFPVHFAL
ncbi:MAG: hypothetical protein ACI84R_003760, partial [Candidatus Azotimanducaceae bacterium]